eukprot:366249-Chlamydomonas_euryale.AAC.6
MQLQPRKTGPSPAKKSQASQLLTALAAKASTARVSIVLVQLHKCKCCPPNVLTRTSLPLPPAHLYTSTSIMAQIMQKRAVASLQQLMSAERTGKKLYVQGMLVNPPTSSYSIWSLVPPPAAVLLPTWARNNSCQ